ncbi:hypothetical protein FHR81_002915 [Actinoalloteichus hoggarensis]|uniref:Uncharacterized protein n=1 Tax=Actinoalloteichus hoggarensis TaxID=1470176 RepID=A0A221VYC7_9PSEU|nr:hypothetical protein [Actinoalloteichus hoggarensis]ASO18507.1 hypothetical protein AHOG_04255 [Actinoalloteichus hoggarensis]MBB5921875.1 hypothetical protein [Actinoalloteichus hoggarensis]
MRGWADRVIFAVLLVDAVVIALIGMFFLPLYVGTLQMPVTALLTAVANLWLVREAARLSPRLPVVVAPLGVWLAVVVVFAMVRPGGDVVLVDDWRSFLLLAAGSLPAAMAVGTLLARGPAAESSA